MSFKVLKIKELENVKKTLVFLVFLNDLCMQAAPKISKNCKKSLKIAFGARSERIQTCSTISIAILKNMWNLNPNWEAKTIQKQLKTVLKIVACFNIFFAFFCDF